MLRGMFNALHVSNEDAKSLSPVERLMMLCPSSLVGVKWACMSRIIELLFVDDGSPDDSGKICDKYADKDKRIRVIHKKNEGVSIARNTGIEAATGKYICFIDSDDFIKENYLETLLHYKNEYSEYENTNKIHGKLH